VHVQSDDGEDLNAEFDVEADGEFLLLVLESAGGGGGQGRHARNHQYVPALRVLLSRLRDRQAVLVDAAVASRHLAHLSDDERTLMIGPERLGAVSDIEGLRLRITTAQGSIGLPLGAKKPGNNRKRIRLRLTVPGYDPDDRGAGRLARDLAETTGGSSGDDRISASALGSIDRMWIDGGELLKVLVDIPLHTSTGAPNKVLKVEGDTALVATDTSPGGQPVPVADVQRGLDRLMADRSVLLSVDVLGHRSSFVGAALATLPGATFATDPRRVVLGQVRDTEVAGKSFVDLDGVAEVKVRREQGYLRDRLLDGRESAPCALCGDTYPKTFLVAAHIKKRAECTDEERRDIYHVAMLACSFGCDSLYENGWITVDESGVIHSSSRDTSRGRLAAQLRALDGHQCPAHGPASAPYFEWHRDKHCP
jgi:hypothetical protein